MFSGSGSGGHVPVLVEPLVQDKSWLHKKVYCEFITEENVSYKVPFFQATFQHKVHQPYQGYQIFSCYFSNCVLGLILFFSGNYQADNLRQQTLQQMHRILTTRQSARALLAINDYFSRLRALSSLWLARPRE